MNQYKLAWMQECNADIQPLQSSVQPHQSEGWVKSVTDHVVEEVVDRAIVWGVVTGLSYMATTQIQNPLIRGPISIIGKAGLRLIPVIGVAYMAYSIYDWFDD